MVDPQTFLDQRNLRRPGSHDQSVDEKDDCDRPAGARNRNRRISHEGTMTESGVGRKLTFCRALNPGSTVNAGAPGRSWALWRQFRENHAETGRDFSSASFNASFILFA